MRRGGGPAEGFEGRCARESSDVTGTSRVLEPGRGAHRPCLAHRVASGELEAGPEVPGTCGAGEQDRRGLRLHAPAAVGEGAWGWLPRGLRAHTAGGAPPEAPGPARGGHASAACTDVHSRYLQPRRSCLMDPTVGNLSSYEAWQGRILTTCTNTASSSEGLGSSGCQVQGSVVGGERTRRRHRSASAQATSVGPR